MNRADQRNPASVSSAPASVVAGIVIIDTNSPTQSAAVQRRYKGKAQPGMAWHGTAAHGKRRQHAAKGAKGGRKKGGNRGGIDAVSMPHPRRCQGGREQEPLTTTQQTHSTAQHRTAPHSTAQHRTAPHSTAQHNSPQLTTTQKQPMRDRHLRRLHLLGSYAPLYLAPFPRPPRRVQNSFGRRRAGPCVAGATAVLKYHVTYHNEQMSAFSGSVHCEIVRL